MPNLIVSSRNQYVKEDRFHLSLKLFGFEIEIRLWDWR